MILVTGGTGFIGRAVVARLVAAGRDVAVLARRRDARDARARVAAALGDEAAGVSVVEGELAAEGAGLAPDERRWLRERVETVVHCAGDTSFAPRLSAPYVAAHVDGPVALLRALAGGRLERWVHMSTAYVCGTREGTIREDEGDLGQTFHHVVRDAPRQAAMLALLVERLGVSGLRLLDARSEPLVDPSPLERRVARMLGPYRAYLGQDVRFDDTAAAAALTRVGVPSATLTAGDVRRLVDLALLGEMPAPV